MEMHKRSSDRNRKHRLVLCLCSFVCCATAFAQVLVEEPSVAGKPSAKPELRVFTSESKPVITSANLWTPDMTPIDFLDGMGAKIKARWRQLYRQPPPSPSTERVRAAFALGALVADSYLAMEATDAQQFRNTGQDILAYCRVLGIGEKMSPRLMSEGKLSEDDKWVMLRQEVVDGHQQLIRVLREMRDDDLAVLVDLGLWLRMIEIVSNMVQQAPENKAWAMCVGSPSLVKDFNARYIQLTAATQKDERILWLGEFITYLQRFGDEDQQPDEIAALKVHEKITSLMLKLTLK
jgi:hypothetical protein